MADIIHQLQATIPAGTLKSALVTVSLQLPPEVIQQVDIDVPPGPAGLMGFYLACSGQQVIPFETGQFLIWDDREKDWPLENFPTNAKWSIVGYNLGAFDHTVVVRFHSQSAVPTTVDNNIPSVTFITSVPDDSDSIGIAL